MATVRQAAGTSEQNTTVAEILFLVMVMPSGSPLTSTAGRPTRDAADFSAPSHGMTRRPLATGTPKSNIIGGFFRALLSQPTDADHTRTIVTRERHGIFGAGRAST